jgi:hypothetical protein
LSPNQESDPSKEPEPERVSADVPGRFVLDLPESEHHKEKRKNQKRTFFDKVKRDFFRRLHKFSFFIQIATLVGLFCYAHSASIQATANQKAANEALKANRLAHDNAIAQLRAYVALGNEQGKLADSVHVTPDGFTVALNFYNAGQTPAKHFSAKFLDVGPRQLHFRERWGDDASRMRVARGLNGPAVAIASRATYTMELPYKITSPPGDGAFIGFFEYCDVFGIYRCEGFQLNFREEPEPHVTLSSDTMLCPLGPEVDKPTFNPLFRKVPNWQPLPRCEQPSESEADQGAKAEQ